MIHVYALAKIRQVNRKDRLKNMRDTTGSRHANRRQRGPQCDFECLPMCDWASLIGSFVTPFGYTGLRLVNKTLMARLLDLDNLLWIMS